MTDLMTSRPQNDILRKASFFWRPKWFLITRFIAVAGVAGALLFFYAIGVRTIDFTALVILLAILLFTNLAYVLYYRSKFSHERYESVAIQTHLAVFTVIQINIDLVILTLMLHYSGGATNPFIFYYFFHSILASILLSKRAAYIEAIIASGMFCGMTLLEGLGLITHYNLLCPGCHTQPLFISGVSFALTSALITSVYMATSIMERLRAHREALEHALNETERLEDEKSRFLDVVAHDLKTPLTSIETMVASNLTVFGEELPEQVKHTLERIPVRTGQLLKLVQELLDFSHITKLDDLTLDFKPLNFLPIVTTSVEMYMPDAMQRNIAVKLTTDQVIPTVRGNKNHLERMVGNLISNAVRYTPNNGSVNVKVTAREGWVILTVADNGIGIPEDEIPNIFKNFFRAKNARKMDQGGTGLGLSITKAIVKKHNGTISFTSTEGEGTVFTVKLPAVI
ncbi:sensor histidine kinase [Candidatus Latescibacterota bacterium]